MRPSAGFTLIEAALVLTIIGVLSTFALYSGRSAVQAAYFVDLKDAAARLALAQQAHRQIHNRFATTVVASGTSNTTTLVFSDASKYQFTITNDAYNEFTATVTVLSSTAQPTPECGRIEITSRRGITSFQTSDLTTGVNTTSKCLRNE